MQRVLVIGPCGAGKSTLARKLAASLDLPVFHMDQLNWQSGWVESSKDEIRGKLGSITAGDRWLIDGTYGGTLPERLDRADTIIYLDFPIILCVWRVLRRLNSYRGRTRPDMTPGCPERFDAAFLWYLICWNYGPRVRLERLVIGHTEKLHRLRSPDELDAWWHRLEHEAQLRQGNS